MLVNWYLTPHLVIPSFNMYLLALVMSSAMYLRARNTVVSKAGVNCSPLRALTF